MKNSPRTTQDDPSSTAPDSGSVKGTGEVTNQVPTYGETPLDPGLDDHVASAQKRAKDGLVRATTGQTEAEFQGAPNPVQARPAGNTEGPKVLSEKVPMTDFSREQPVNDISPPFTPEPDQPAADQHEISDADIPVETSTDELEAPSADESSAPRDRLAGVLTFFAAPRRRLPPSNRRMLDAAAITFALWVPIAWGYAIFAPRTVESASVEGIPAPNQFESAVAAEPVDSSDPIEDSSNP